MTGLCWHCGNPDAPVTHDGFIGRHTRDGIRPGGAAQIPCAGSYMAEGFRGLRPGAKCEHGLAILESHCAKGVPNVVGQAH